MKAFVFIYYKKETDRVKVLGLADAKEEEACLLASGYKHTATLDAAAFIEDLLVPSVENLADRIKSLSIKP